jgi:hypothetical protein
VSPYSTRDGPFLIWHVIEQLPTPNGLLCVVWLWRTLKKLECPLGPGPLGARSSEPRAAQRSALSSELSSQLAARRAVGHWGHGPGRACALCPCALGPRCPVPCPAHCACAAQSLLTAIHSMASCSCSAQCCVRQCCVLLPAAAAAQRPAAARTQSPRCRRCRCTCATTHNALIYCQRGRGRGSSCRQAGGRRGGWPVTSSCCRSLCSAELSAFSSGSGGGGVGCSAGRA